MVKKRKVTSAKAKPTKKKTSKQNSKKGKTDWMWLFLKMLFVIALISVVIFYVTNSCKSVSSRTEVQEQKTDNKFELQNNRSDEIVTEQDIIKEELPKEKKRVSRTYTMLEIPDWHTTISQQQIRNLGYTASYNTSMGIPNWVAYELTRSEATSNKAKRKDRFKPDPKVIGKSAHNSDYKGSGYDKGHMAPAADMKWNQTVMDQSFYFSNICPQAPGLNRGAWKELEEEIRQWAIRDSAIVIICGPLFTQEPIRYIPETTVAIPDAYFKVVCSPYTEQERGIAFVFPNTKASKHPRNYVVTIDSVEKMTGMDFLSQLPDEIENEIEKTSNYTQWE